LTASAIDSRLRGEHSIGHKRKQYMRYSVSEVSLDMMKRVKKALDPNDILNPGKIFD
jgi:glycolate oxidase